MRSFRTNLLLLLLILSGMTVSLHAQERGEKMNEMVTSDSHRDWILVLHGGAGTILKENMSPERERSIRTVLDSALLIGGDILDRGGSSLDAVVAVVSYLEDSPHFNAGKGAVFTHDGKNELDASIMEGKDLKAGAVAGVTTVRNPVRAARAVMEHSEHVMLSGEGANEFARNEGLEIVDPSYFYTKDRYESLKNRLERNAGKEDKKGTVGAVALDRNGNLAAATSTGGMTDKKFNRIGDSPVIGAGTYADNRTCAVSCTGHGEYFIRYAVAHDLSARLLYAGQKLEEAAENIINEQLKQIGASGGLIAVDQHGNYAMPFNTAGMYRGVIHSDYRAVFLYK